MKKNSKHLVYVLVLLMSMLAVGTVFALTTRKSFDLHNFQGTNSTANAMITTLDKNGLYDLRIELIVKDLMSTPGHVYNVWLIDEDSNTTLSLGAFNTNKMGVGNFKYEETVINPYIYDEILITEEPMNQIHPMQSKLIFGEIIPNSESKKFNLIGILSNNEQVPKTNSRARGNATFILDSEKGELSYSINFSGLRGDETGAHIHGFAPDGKNAGILFTLPLGNNIKGVWHYNKSDEEKILAGLTYVNIHSTVYPNGEIRGQIEVNPTMAIPHEGGPLDIDIHKLTFNPSVLKIKKGQTLTWTNLDVAPHTVNSKSGNELNSTILFPGDKYVHTFNTTGTFAYHCLIHDEMNGEIIVE